MRAVAGRLAQRPTLRNLKYTVDFRSVYQTLIRDWLQGDASTVLGASYPELPVINSA
jgi:uncharacterized protein (DUF1501 family)